MSSEQRRLESLLIQEQFGPLVAKAIKPLFVDELGLKQIAAQSGLSAQQVRESIFALLQHDLVKKSGDGRARQSSASAFKYSVDHRRILLRTRLPQLLVLVQQLHGDDAELVFQQMLLHGRVRLRMLIEYVQKHKPLLTAEAITGIFEKLLADHLVVRRISNNSGLTCLESDSIVTEVSFGVDPYVLPPSCWAAAAEPQASEAAAAMAPPSKRARLDSANDVAEAAAAAKKKSREPCWVVNYTQCLRHFRNNWIIGHLRHKVNAQSGEIVKVMLDEALLSERRQAFNTPSLSPRDIRGKLRAWGVADLDNVREYLQVLLVDGDDIVEAPTNGNYQVDFRRVTTLVKELYIDVVIESKFGTSAGRLFRLIQQYSHLEAKQVKELALVGDPKETRTFLNEMFKEKFLQLREIPKQGSREAPNCAYLWTSDINAISRMLCEHSYKAQANLMVRKADIVKKHKVLQTKIGLLADTDEQADRMRAEAYTAEMDTLGLALGKLDNGLLELDHQIMMFRDFDEIDPTKRSKKHLD